MPRTNRNTLKEYFKRGKMPEERHFYELIDSAINIVDDGINKTPDDGLRLSPLKKDGPVIGIFKNIQDNRPAWQLSLDANGRLLIRQEDEETPLIVLSPDKKIELNQPHTDVHINGQLSAQAFNGEIQGKFPANGEWHTFDIPTEGCRAYRIMAGCGKIKCGQYALVQATAMHCYGKHRKIRTTQSWFGSFFNRIKFRWHGYGQKCKLQIRTNRDYGADIHICFQITDLWNDPKMEHSDLRINPVPEL